MPSAINSTSPAFRSRSAYMKKAGGVALKICNALRADNLPMPEYTVNPGDIMIKFTSRKDHIVRMPRRLSDKLTDKEQKTLELLLEYPGYTSPQIAEKLNVSRVSVTKYLKVLKEKGLVERVGSDRKGYWKIVN